MNTVPKVRDSETGAVDLEQVGAVDVAELGRHEAVDEPREEDDLGRVLQARCGSPVPRRRSAQRRPRSGKPSVEHDERGEEEQRVRLAEIPPAARRASMLRHDPEDERRAG